MFTTSTEDGRTMEDIQQQLTRVLETHRTGDHDTARAECAELLISAPELPDAHYVMGLLIQDTGDHQQASQLLGRAIRIDPDRAEFHDAIGVSLVSLGKHREGLCSFAEAVRLEPENRLAVMHLGLLSLRLGLADTALPCFESLMNMGETGTELLSLRGQALYRLNRYQEAVEWLHRCLDIAPEHIDAHRYLARTLLKLERYSEAITCFQFVTESEPHNSQILILLGEALMGTGALNEAEKVLLHAIDLDHSQHQAHANLGHVQAALGLTEEPLRSFLTALRLRPHDFEYRCQLGHLLLQQGYLPKAEHCFRLVLRQQPYHVDAIAGLATVLSKMGDNEGAIALAEPLIKAGTDHVDLAYIYAVLCRKLERSRDAIPVLVKLLNRSRPVQSRAQLLHALGELYETSHQHELAFKTHREANEATDGNFQPEEFKSHVTDMIEVFRHIDFPHLPRSENPTRIPVLIVGMPRTGTTLVEQILATHPNVMGAGELEELQMLARALPEILGTNTPYPHCIDQLSSDIATHLSIWYTERMVTKAGDATRITDKMPQNFLHLGLAALLLPNIRIVHCRRNPMDTALSCYFMHFKESHAFTTDLETLGQFYVQYERLMQHWREVLPLPILDVQYEDMVTYPEETMRRIVDFAGLSWHPDCTRFYSNDRDVLTASAEQVRQPIYNTSVNRHKPYSAELDPFRKVLIEAGIVTDQVPTRLH
jgi:tetratricopeptide (TPR) repeat protein